MSLLNGLGCILRDLLLAAQALVFDQIDYRILYSVLKSGAVDKPRQCVDLIQRVTGAPERDHGHQHHDNQEQSSQNCECPEQGLVRELYRRYTARAVIN